MKAYQAHNQELVEIGRQKKAAKGVVKIEINKGWLRLRFTYQGKRYAHPEAHQAPSDAPIKLKSF